MNIKMQNVTSYPSEHADICEWDMFQDQQYQIHRQRSQNIEPALLQQALNEPPFTWTPLRRESLDTVHIKTCLLANLFKPILVYVMIRELIQTYILARSASELCSNWARRRSMRGGLERDMVYRGKF